MGYVDIDFKYVNLPTFKENSFGFRHNFSITFKEEANELTKNEYNKIIDKLNEVCKKILEKKPNITKFQCIPSLECICWYLPAFQEDKIDYRDTFEFIKSLDYPFEIRIADFFFISEQEQSFSRTNRTINIQIQLPYLKVFASEEDELEELAETFQEYDKFIRENIKPILDNLQQ